MLLHERAVMVGPFQHDLAILEIGQAVCISGGIGELEPWGRLADLRRGGRMTRHQGGRDRKQCEECEFSARHRILLGSGLTWSVAVQRRSNGRWCKNLRQYYRVSGICGRVEDV